jgi:hypothetical protein
MLQDFLQLIPNEPTTIALVVAMAGTVIGSALWLAGVKMSRPTVTLFTVVLGAAVGMELPRWFGWNISGAGPAVGAAVVLGVSGFVLHRLWIGLGLGLTIALWAALGLWIARHGTQPWSWPAIDPRASCWSYLKDVWAQVPPEVARPIPSLCGVAMIAGLAFTILWPKLATALCWSMIGLSLLVTMGIGAMDLGRRTWLDHLPQHTWSQLATLGVMLTIGTIIQCQLQRTPAGARREESSAKSDRPKLDEA